MSRPTTTPSDRGGVVYLAHRSSGAERPTGEAWSGYWERWDPPGMLGEGAWRAAAEAIAWGRERCDLVIVRLDTPPRQFSAGAAAPPGEDLPPWPPGDADRFDL